SLCPCVPARILLLRARGYFFHLSLFWSLVSLRRAEGKCLPAANTAAKTTGEGDARMKLVRFEAAGHKALGAVTRNGDDIVDLARALTLSGATEAATRIPASMAAFLARGEAGLAAAARALEHPPAEAILPQTDVRLLAPVGDPPKILCIGQNYRDHCEEQNQPIPDRAI